MSTASDNDVKSGRPSRLDELLAGLLDGSLTQPERQELDALWAAAEPVTRARARALFELEAGLLRGGAEALNDPALVPLSAGVLEAIAHKDRAAVAAVMGDVERAAPVAQRVWSERTHTRQRQRTASRLRWLVAGLTLVGAAAMALWGLRHRMAEPRWADDVRAASAVEDAPWPALRSRPAPPRLPEGLGAAAPGSTEDDHEPGALDASARSGTRAPEGHPLWTYDFEDGESPAELESGGISPGPPRPGNRFVAVGGVWRWAPRTNLVFLDLWKSGRALRWDPRVVLRFDYWAGPDTRRLVVQTFNGSRNLNIHRVFDAPITGQWARATVRMIDLVPNDGSDRFAEPGDELINLVILGGRIAGPGLFVDNVRPIEIPEGEDLPPTELLPLD